jgi:signal peptide peptidase SppA
MLNLIELIAGRPWAVRAELAAHVHGLLAREGIAGLRHLAGLKQEIHAHDGAQAAARGRGRSRDVSTVAVITAIGTLTQRREIIGSDSTRSTADIVAGLQEAVADPKVDAAVLEVDSGGGEVFGVPEAWQAIREAAKAKPVVASVNSVAGSAAYYLASAADEVWVTPSGMVGSVGVYALHIDASKALEDMGESWEFIVAKDSPFKVEGNPAGPLTAEAREALQADIDRYMAMFIRDLARGRSVSRDTVRQQFGGGRMKGPEDARAVGMVDQMSQLGQERREGAAPQGARVAVVGPGPGPEAQTPAPAAPQATEEAPTPAVEPEEPPEAQDARRRLWESA